MPRVHVDIRPMLYKHDFIELTMKVFLQTEALL